jgi:sugar/nucleoside kinase (ribokinase family)
LVVGGTGIDTVVPVAGLPVPVADSVPPVGPILDRVAHTGTGVALGLRALGVPVTVVDALGDDAAGHQVAAAFADWGVPLRTAVAPAGTRRAVNLMDPGGRRLSFYDGRDTPGYRLPPMVYRTELSEVRHVHVTIMDWARHLLADARAAGCSISTDLHDWDGDNSYHRDFALGADVVFLSAVRLGRQALEVARWILADGVASQVVVTNSEAGADLIARRDPDVTMHEPAADPGAPIVDTNGAGDAFAAAFLAAWLGGLDDAACLRQGAVAGAYACTRHVGGEAFIDAATLARRA